MSPSDTNYPYYQLNNSQVFEFMNLEISLVDIFNELWKNFMNLNDISL